MIRNQMLAMCAVVTAAGCGGNMYETVSIRFDDISCTERIYSEDETSISGSIVQPYDSTPVRGSVSVDLPVPSQGKAKPEKRCDTILQAAAEAAAINEELKQAKLTEAKLAAQLKALELAKVKRKLEEDQRDLDAEW